LLKSSTQTDSYLLSQKNISLGFRRHFSRCSLSTMLKKCWWQYLSFLTLEFAQFRYRV
jgi:hypothetical protein